jgi:hypothetical protein
MFGMNAALFAAMAVMIGRLKLFRHIEQEIQ